MVSNDTPFRSIKLAAVSSQYMRANTARGVAGAPRRAVERWRHGRTTRQGDKGRIHA